MDPRGNARAPGVVDVGAGWGRQCPARFGRRSWLFAYRTLEVEHAQPEHGDTRDPSSIELVADVAGPADALRLLPGVEAAPPDPELRGALAQIRRARTERGVRRAHSSLGSIASRSAGSRARDADVRRRRRGCGGGVPARRPLRAVGGRVGRGRELRPGEGPEGRERRELEENRARPESIGRDLPRRRDRGATESYAGLAAGARSRCLPASTSRRARQARSAYPIRTGIAEPPPEGGFATGARRRSPSRSCPLVGVEAAPPDREPTLIALVALETGIDVIARS